LKAFLKSKNNVAIIPFYNEENFIEKVVVSALKYVDYLILVNDGSTDNSIDFLPQDEKIILLQNETNLGKGAALNSGFLKAMNLGSEYVVTLDGDGQHDPEKLPDFYTMLRDYDVVIGERRRIPGIMPVQRILSNFITSSMLSVKLGQKIHDSQSGYRGYRVSVLPNMLPQNKGFMAETEILINLCRAKCSIGYLPIETIYDDQKSKMNPIGAILDFIRLILFG